MLVFSKSIISDGCEICGEVHSSVLGNNVIVTIQPTSNSIIMDGVKIGDGCVIEKAIIAENTTIENVKLDYWIASLIKKCLIFIIMILP